MRNFLTGLLKASCYFALYFFIQIIVSFFAAFSAVFGEIMADPSLLDTMAGVEALTEKAALFLQENSLPILIISTIAILAFLIIFFRLRKKRLTREAWLLPVRTASLWPVVVAAAALAFFVSIGMSYIPWPASVIDEYNSAYAVIDGDGILALVATILAAPFLEELIFRGLVFTRLCRGMPGPAALILTSTIFGFMHGTILWAAYAFVCAVVMTLVFMKYRSLWASILMHVIFNLFGGYIIYLIPASPVLELLLLAGSGAVLVATGIYMYRMPREKIDKPAPALKTE